MYSINDFKVGTKMIGNVNKVIMEVVKIENNKLAVIRSMNSEKLFTYGLEALTRCNVTIIS